MPFVDSCKLQVKALRWTCDPEQFDFETTSDLPDLLDAVGQERALRSIEFGLGVRETVSTCIFPARPVPAALPPSAICLGNGLKMNPRRMTGSTSTTSRMPIIRSPSLCLPAGEVSWLLT